MLVDSHCHLNYLDDPFGALQRARRVGVSACLCIGVEHRNIHQVLALAAEHSDVWASVGEHPGACSGDPGWIEDYIHQPGVVALGEMGLDYLDTPASTQAQQRTAFAQQMALAARHDMPVVIHTRAAVEDTLAIMAEFPGVRGVLHCFTESWEMAEQALAMGYYISMSGIVTFKNARNVQTVARQIPLDRLLVETDAPWLAPVPHRGKTNEPAFVAHTLDYLAELRQQPREVLCDATGENFYRLFSRASSQVFGKKT